MTLHLTIQSILPWVMSFITIWTIWLAGEKKRSAWVIGLFNQVLWSAFIITTHQWGLLPMTIAITFVYARNLRKWKRDKKLIDGIHFDERQGEMPLWGKGAIERMAKEWRKEPENKNRECRECSAILSVNETGEFCYPCGSSMSD